MLKNIDLRFMIQTDLAQKSVFTHFHKVLHSAYTWPPKNLEWEISEAAVEPYSFLVRVSIEEWDMTRVQKLMNDLIAPFHNDTRVKLEFTI